MNAEFINPNRLFNSTQYGFSQIVACSPGMKVYISGQVAWDEENNIIGKDNLEIQTKKSIENLSIAMEAVGGTLADIVFLRIYKVGSYSEEDGIIISEALKTFFDINSLPASTWISVNGLPTEIL